MSVVGIDLGYQNSVIASAGRGGVDVTLNGSSNRLNPSMVGFSDARRMGEGATSGVTSNLKNTVKGMKRLVGLAFDDPRAVEEMKWHPGVTFQPVSHATGGPATIGVLIHAGSDNEKIVPIEHIAGMMIHHMGEIAGKKAAEGTDASAAFPQDWVVAIPNYFTDSQRRALQAGCEIVGINGVQRFMHENTATALAYGIFKDLKKEFTKDSPTNVMFIDMGASAYSVSIATFEPGKFKVKAAFCDADLGGRNFDKAIATWIATKFEEKYKGKLSGKPMERPKTVIKLMTAAEKAKKTLSPAGVKEAHMHLEMLMDDLDFSVHLKATEYETMCAPLLARLEAPIKNALEEAKLTSADLASVEIVGGSTRIGCVKRRLLEILGVDTLSTTMNADEAVARGAALQSAILSPRFKVLPYNIEEAQPYPIQVKWEATDGEETDSVVMFERGVSFPIVRRVTLKRAGAFEVKAVYDPEGVGKYNLPPTCTDIATFSIKNTSNDPVKVRVNVKQDIHGIVQLSSAQMVEEVEAEEGDTTKEGEEGAAADEEKKKKVKKTNLDCTVTRPFDWAKEEINKNYEVEVAMANTDRIVTETANMRNELESYIYDMRDKVGSDSHLGPYGSEEEKAAFLAKNEAIENWLYEDGFDATKSVYAEKLAELKALGSPMEKRLSESQNRAEAIKSLQSNLEIYSNWVNESQTDEKYSHITDEEREKVRSKVDEVSAWMYEMQDKQGGLALNEDPVLTVSELNKKSREVTDVGAPIKFKAKPKPPPAPTPAPAPEETKTEPMDTKGDEGGEMEVELEESNGDKMDES